MHSTFNKVLLLQFTQMYKKQGFRSLCLYLMKVFNYRVIKRYFKGSYSQKGEDLMIDKYLNHKKRGINIEPNPERIKFFFKKRTKDINLNIGIGSKEGKVLFYGFEFPALSTFSKKEAYTLTKVGYKLKKKMKIQMYKLEQIMKKYVKSDIDFITKDKGISDRKDNISKYLLSKGYKEYHSNGLNTLYEDIQN